MPIKTDPPLKTISIRPWKTYSRLAEESLAAKLSDRSPGKIIPLTHGEAKVLHKVEWPVSVSNAEHVTAQILKSAQFREQLDRMIARPPPPWPFPSPPPTRWQRFKWKLSDYRNRVSHAWDVLRGRDWE